MRTPCKLAVVLLFTAHALAQCLSLKQAASENSSSHNRHLTSQFRQDGITLTHRWYWDDAGFSGLPPTPIEREQLFSTYNDFAPLTVSWTLSGVHWKVPLLDVVGFDVKPGAQEFNPDSLYGSMDRPKLWNRASHAIMSALRY